MFSNLPGFETETITRAELDALKWSSRKAWIICVLVLGGAGTAGYYGWKERTKLVASTRAFPALEREHKEALAKLEKQGAELATIEKAKTTAGPDKGASAVSPAAKEAGAKLAADLKKQLAPAKEVVVEQSEDKVVVALPASLLFSGTQTELALGGFRVLFRVGKALKGIKDRQVLVTAQAGERKKLKGAIATNWELSAVRATAVARFLVDDAGFDPKLVSSSAHAPHKSGRNARGERVEIVLQPAAAAPSPS